MRANSWLRKCDSQLRVDNLCLSAGSEAIEKYAEGLAIQCWKLRERLPDSQAWERATNLAARHLMGNRLQGGKNERIELGRVVTTRWWSRGLRKLRDRSYEAIRREAGFVNQARGVYCSNPAYDLFQWGQIATQQYLKEHQLVNQLGECVSLLDIYNSNVSSPAIRRAELMARFNGVEQMSLEAGHEAVFITITAPSRFHAYDRKGRANKRYDGSTPADGQKWLNHKWSLIRAEYGRKGIQPYGFRIAEPNHDGTPHWHLLLFLPAEQLKELLAVLKKKLHQEASTSYRRHGLKIEKIDPLKGSATGYLAKYISKNIDGACIDTDNFGNSASTAAQRVRAWASLWGIRQFQPIGSQPSVTVYRELRKIRTQLEGDAESARAAADSGDWSSYVQFMGGFHVPNRNRPILPLRSKEADSQRVIGLIVDGSPLVTRLNQWRKIAIPSRQNPGGVSSRAERERAPPRLPQ